MATQARLYYDSGRSRLFESEWTGFESFWERAYDFSFFTCKRAARFWCELNGVEFVDNSLDRVAADLHRSVLAARKAGSPKLDHIAAYHPWEAKGLSERPWFAPKLSEEEWEEFKAKLAAREEISRRGMPKHGG